MQTTGKTSMRMALNVAAIMILAGTALTQDFSYPQGVYDGAKVKHGTLPNGGIVNKALLERMKQTQPERPFTVKVTDGVWALVGYLWGYTALIEGKTSLILYDTADDIEEGHNHAGGSDA